MSVSQTFRTFVLDQLSRATHNLRAKSMFGGVGIYAGDYFFALIDDDTLYLKVDDTNRGDFEERGMTPFQPFGEGGEVMQYYRVPDDLLEDADAIKPWVDKAVDVARRQKMRGSRRKRTARP